MNDLGVSNCTLTHFHVCVHCGSAFRREEFIGRAITSGIYHCTKCGFDGPLNIEIREVEDPAGNKDHPSDANL
jgi:predicted RNA-binding Zn-ribbon protein involved in translation (DUF1610 family)